MPSGRFPFPGGLGGTKIMVFVDGENLAARYGELLGDSMQLKHVAYHQGVYAWTTRLHRIGNPPLPVVRHYYYTSAVGSDEGRDKIHDELSSLGIEAPRVFPKRKGKRAKRVDISLSVDMLSHAHRRNYDLAVLVAGDEDYVPLVEAVEAEGRRVVLWFFRSGLSPALERRVDHFFDLKHAFLEDRQQDFRGGHYH
jgi:uncharacterized LabA/DUF88 family protein